MTITNVVSDTVGRRLALVTVASVALAVAGCSDAGSGDGGALAGNPPPATPELAGAPVLGEFILHVRPKERSMTIERVGAAHGPGVSPQSIDSLTIGNDGVPGSGPANSVELVTNSVDYNDACPAPYTTDTFCGNITLRSFFASRPLNNVFVQVTAIVDANNNDISSGHTGANSDPSVYGLSNSLGLWKYTGTGETASGVLGQADATANGANAGERDWVFNNPDDANTNIRLRVVASLGYTTYSRPASSVGWVDACTTAGATINPQTPGTFSTTLPYGFTVYGTTYTQVNANKNGVVTFGATAVPGGANKALPDSGVFSPKPGVFPYWANLDYNDATSAVCSVMTGSEPNRKFVLTWKKMKLSGSASGTDNLTFSAFFTEGSDRIDFAYNTMTSSVSANQTKISGNSTGVTGGSTIGMQKDGTTSTQTSVAIGGTPVNGAVGACNANNSCKKYAFVPTP